MSLFKRSSKNKQTTRNTTANKASQPGQKFDGSFQLLEERRMLTAYTVNTTMDDASGGMDGLVSLREAIIAAETNAAFGDALAGDADGDTIVFDASIADSDINISGNGEFTITDDVSIGDLTSFVTIDGEMGTRIFNIDTSETVSFRNFELNRGSVTGSGAAVVLAGGGTLELTDMVMSQNAATLDGGAIFNDESTLTIEDSRFFANTTGGRGGAIFSLEGTVSASGTAFTSNTAVTAGGAIAVTDAVATLADSDITGNSTSAGNGGGVAGFEISTIRVQGSTISSNTASVNGGGFWMPATGKLAINSASDVTTNTASGDAVGNGGGGIYSGGALVRILDSVVSSNTADGTEGSGGGILSADGILNIRRTTIAANKAAAFGGGIEVGGGYARLEGSTLGGPGNTDANFAGLNSGLGDGGGLHVSGGANTIVEIDSSSVSHNLALRNGGAFWNQTDAMMIISGMTFIDNNVSNSSDGGGGAIYNKGGTVVVNSSTVTQNDAQGGQGLGGGIYSVGGLLVIADSSINQNEARRAGGGISIDGGIATLTNSDLTSNSVDHAAASPGNGGGIYIVDSSYTLFDSTTVTMNTAANLGGGIAAFNSLVVAQNGSSVVSNTAESQTTTNIGGGGIYANEGTVRILESMVNSNMATGADATGGGIAAENSVNVFLRSSTMASNSAVKKGGAVHAKNSTAVFVDSTIGGAVAANGNTAESGAGIYYEQASVGWVNGTTISNNTATLNGGGIFNHRSSNISVAGSSTLSFNSADAGGAIYNAGLLSIIDSTMLINSARLGGGLSNQPSAITEIDTANIDGNSASFVGGGVQNAGIVKFLDGGEIKNNTSVNTGGGVFTESEALTILGDVTFNGNTPDDTND